MRNNRWINFVPYLIVILALFSLMNMNTGTATQNLTYNEFQKLVEEQKVTESAVTVGDNVIKIKGVFEQDGKKVGFTASDVYKRQELAAASARGSDLKLTEVREAYRKAHGHSPSARCCGRARQPGECRVHPPTGELIW